MGATRWNGNGRELSGSSQVVNGNGRELSGCDQVVNGRGVGGEWEMSGWGHISMYMYMCLT